MNDPNYKKLLNRYSLDLPSTVMGEKNYNKAMKETKRYVDEGNFMGARKYVKSQLQKIAKQAEGTMTEAKMNEILNTNRYRGI